MFILIYFPYIHIKNEKFISEENHNTENRIPAQIKHAYFTGNNKQ